MRSAWLPKWVGVPLTMIALLLCTHAAWAQGRVQWKSKTVKESDESWKIEVTIFLNKAPDVSLVPMRFSFTPVAYYERALVDNREEPVRVVKPLQNRQPLVESVDVGFMDTGTGKVEKRTRFSLRLTRARGYEAGEYDIEIKDARSNQSIGTKQTLALEGDNPVIDRRAMDFSAEKEKPKKDEPEPEAAPSKAASEYSPDDPAYWEGGPSEPEPQEEDRPPPASMREGGCGCHVVGRSGLSAPFSLSLGVALFGVTLVRRRRAGVSASVRRLP